jgi:hypothetical protein
MSGKTSTVVIGADTYTLNNGTTTEAGTYAVTPPKITLTPNGGTAYTCTYSVPIPTKLTLLCPNEGFDFNTQGATRR